MNVLGPPRLRDQPAGLSEAEHAELLAYARDEPSPEARMRMLGELSQATGPEPALRAWLRSKVGLWWLGLGALLLGALGSFAVFSWPPQPPIVPASGPLPASKHESSLREAPKQELPHEPASAPQVVPSGASDLAAPAAPARREFRPAARDVRPNGTGDAAFAELELLLRARRVLPSRPDRALALTAEHARSYPRGPLVEEREILAIEALVKLGRDAPARARARRFLRLFPRSSQCARLRGWLAEESPSP